MTAWSGVTPPPPKDPERAARKYDGQTNLGEWPDMIDDDKADAISSAGMLLAVAVFYGALALGVLTVAAWWVGVL